jgi:hypothetical protein
MQVNYLAKCDSTVVQETTLETLSEELKNSPILKNGTESYRKARLADCEINAFLEKDASANNKEITKADTASLIKRQVKAFFAAARMGEKRTSEGVQALTGWVLCDFDHIPANQLAEARQRVNADAHTLLSYVTISGEGLRVIARYEAELTGTLTKLRGRYRRAFAAVNKYYSQLIGHPYDEACKDLTRLSIMAYDPEAYFHPDCTPFTRVELASPEEIEEMNKRIEQADQRHADKEARRQQNKMDNLITQVYNHHIKPDLARWGVEYKSGNHNNYVMRVGYLLNKFGIEEQYAVEWARQQFVAYPEAASVVKSCYTRTEEFGTLSDDINHFTPGKKRQRKATVTEVEQFIDTQIDRRFNELTECVEIRWKEERKNSRIRRFAAVPNDFTPITDRDCNTLIARCDKMLNLRTNLCDIQTNLNSESTPNFDPVMDFFDRLPQWTPGDHDYIADMAATVRVLDEESDAQEYFTYMLKKCLVSMVHGWLNGHPSSIMLCFIGRQGTGKSRWMQCVLPPQLRAYMRIKQNSGQYTKDDIIQASTQLLTLNEEIDAMSEAEMNNLKSLLTSVTSSERGAYAHNAELRYNVTANFATGNKQRFIADTTGSRRFAPFTVEILQSPYDVPFDYEGIYAQAYAMATSADYAAYITEEEQVRLEAHNQPYVTVNYERELVGQLFRQPGPQERGQWMPASFIAQRLYEYFRFFRVDVNRIGEIMKELGFEEVSHEGVTGYVLHECTYEEMRNSQTLIAMLPRVPKREAADKS